MREYTSDELIIIGRCHALQSERERLLSEIKINQSAMSGISLGYSDEPERLLGLLEEQINLVSASVKLSLTVRLHLRHIVRSFQARSKIMGKTDSDCQNL